MFRVSIDIDLGPIQQQVLSVIFPAVTHAVAFVAEHGANEWRDAVFKAHLWQVEKNAYIDSIQWKMVGNDASSISAEIWSDYRLADDIENGRPARDLKQYLQTSHRVRTSKSGSRYLIIPFRHNIPGNDAHAAPMPERVYALAKKMSKSYITGMGSRISGSGHLVPQASYSWGHRLPAGLMPKAKPHHKTDLYSGMVRMQTSSGKSKSSAYLTFRVMSEHSTGWIVPAKPGLNLVKKISDDLQPILEQAIAKAITI